MVRRTCAHADTVHVFVRVRVRALIGQRLAHFPAAVPAAERVLVCGGRVDRCPTTEPNQRQPGTTDGPPERSVNRHVCRYIEGVPELAPQPGTWNVALIAPSAVAVGTDTSVGNSASNAEAGQARKSAASSVRLRYKPAPGEAFPVDVVVPVVGTLLKVGQSLAPSRPFVRSQPRITSFYAGHNAHTCRVNWPKQTNDPDS